MGIFIMDGQDIHDMLNPESKNYKEWIEYQIKLAELKPNEDFIMRTTKSDVLIVLLTLEAAFKILDLKRNREKLVIRNIRKGFARLNKKYRY